MGDKQDELQEQYDRLDLSDIEEGDEITVYARRYIHEPTAFADVEEEVETFSFVVSRKTHPHETNVETWLWEAGSHQKNSEHLNLNEKRDLCNGSEINWFIEKIEVK